MRTFNYSIIRHYILLFIAVGYFYFSGNGQCIFNCADTYYGDDTVENVLRTKYHLIQTFGDVSFKSTNFFVKDYNGLVGWLESRIFLPRFSVFLNDSDNLFPLPDPYFTGLLKGQKGLDWEDRFDYGLGFEWRPFKNFDLPNNKISALLFHLRIYSIYLKTEFIRPQSGWEWRPTDDLRFGLEVYRECNLYNGKESRFWSELWSDFSWRKTNFVVKDYKGWTFAIVPRWGIKLFPERFTLMPYLTGELAVTCRKTEFWQNRVLAGIGVRTMPFSRAEGTWGVFLKGMRVYVEGMHVLAYINNNPPPGTPNHDIRFGVTYVINRW